MVKGRAFDVAPSAATVTLAVPAAARSAAGTRAVTCDALTKVVTSGVPFQAIVAPDGKLLPLTVRVRSALPAEAEAGLRLVMAAGGVDAFTVKTGACAETTDPLTTWTTFEPTLAMALAGTLTLSWLTLT